VDLCRANASLEPTEILRLYRKPGGPCKIGALRAFRRLNLYDSRLLGHVTRPAMLGGGHVSHPLSRTSLK
jgi:hypothetical protein